MIDCCCCAVVVLEDVDAAFQGRRSEARGEESGAQGGVTLSGCVAACGPALGLLLLGMLPLSDPLVCLRLLNAIDGIGAQESRLLFLTTNFPDMLDPALIRPGRVDYSVRFGPANRDQASRLFQNFFRPPSKGLSPMVLTKDGPRMDPTSVTSKDLAMLGDQFASKLPEEKLSMAAIQGFLLRHRTDPSLAVELVDELLHDGKEGRKVSGEFAK